MMTAEKKKPTKTTKKAEPKAEGPRKITPAQVRVLAALVKKSPLARAELAEKAEIDSTGVGAIVGYTDPEINSRPVHAGNLVNRGYATYKDGEGYSITAAGRKALAAALAEAKAEAKGGSN